MTEEDVPFGVTADAKSVPVRTVARLCGQHLPLRIDDPPQLSAQ